MEIEIQNKDFDKLLFPVNNLLENSNPIKAFPKLEKWPEFTSYNAPARKFSKVFRWIVLTYDMNSPFQKISDVIQRKLEVAKFVKLIDKPSEIKDNVKSILLNTDKQVNKMIIAYARMHRSSKYSLVIGLEHRFYEDLLTSQNGGKITRNLENSQKELESAITNLLSNDSSVNLNEDFYEYIEEDRLENLRPEGIALLLSEGKEPISEEEIA